MSPLLFRQRPSSWLDGREPEVSGPISRLTSGNSAPLHHLQAVWKARPPGGWPDHPEEYHLLGELILRGGEPLLAYDVLVEGMRHRPDDLRLCQLLGLTLARSGAVERGNAMLNALFEQGRTDGETLGILASTHKDLWASAPAGPGSTLHLERSHELYAQAYANSRYRNEADATYYNGINAAATALLLGKEARAREFAREVDALCERVMTENSRSSDPYWILATRAEAALIAGDFDRARVHYAEAAELGKGRHSDLHSTRKQTRLLLTHLGRDASLFDECFAIPAVVVFEGCVASLLCPDGATEKSLRSAIRERLGRHGAGFGYASLVGLADLVFLEEVLALGGEAHVVMPLAGHAFVQHLGPVSTDHEWQERYQRVIDAATQVQGGGEWLYPYPEVARRYTQQVLDGLGRLHSRSIGAELVLLTLAQEGRSLAFDSLLEHWTVAGDTVDVLDVSALGRARPDSMAEGTEELGVSADSFPQRIMAMLFADVAGYSAIAEQEIPHFVRHFMGAVAGLEQESRYQPLLKNTWGDAFTFVFEDTEQAGLFALELSRLIAGIDWRERGIGAPLDLRIALHAGPVYLCEDPIAQRPNFCGTHVNWVARIEPITPPGQVYASQPFAALAEAQRITSFACDYVGQVPLAKGFGEFPLYHVR